MDIIINISVNQDNPNPTINASVDYEKLDELHNVELCYTIMGIIDSIKQKLNYLIEDIEDEDLEEDDEYIEDDDDEEDIELNEILAQDKNDDDETAKFNKLLEKEIEDLLNGGNNENKH